MMAVSFSKCLDTRPVLIDEGGELLPLHRTKLSEVLQQPINDLHETIFVLTDELTKAHHVFDNPPNLFAVIAGLPA